MLCVVNRLRRKTLQAANEQTKAHLEDQGFKGCTHCSYVELLDGFAFKEGGYSEARKMLETLFDQTRVDKPIQPPRFMPMFLKANEAAPATRCGGFKIDPLQALLFIFIA